MPFVLVIILFLIISSVSLNAQDSTRYVLPPLTVEAYREAVPAARVAASLATIRTPVIRRYPTQDLLPALNRVAGVRFEQRAPGSYRVSIRGSTLRAPFGVRNVKVYWNGLPLTEPGGDTPLNFLDPTNVDRIEVLKGPAGSLYGAGTAGTLLLRTDSLSAPLAAAVAAGSFGFYRGDVQVQERLGNTVQQLRYAAQGTNGYRDHSQLFRQTVQYGLQFNPSSSRRLALHALYTDLSYDLPGGLNPEQYAANPQQARPGSAETNAAINYHNLLVGLTQHWTRGAWANESSLYATGFYFDHPFNVDYKRETNLGAGGRTAFDHTYAFAGGALRTSVGGEYQTQLRFGDNFDNADGQPGTLNFSDEILTRQGIVFGQSTLAVREWRITAGLSVNQLEYDVDRTYDANGSAGRVRSDFATALSPRLAVLRSWNQFSAYASVAGGFSPPTLDEFRTNEGSFNVSLAPERGTNYELGAKLNRSRLSLEAALFYFRLSQTITSYSDARDTRLFRNAGSTDQRGLELSATYRVAPWMQLYGAYTYHDFTYDSFVRDEADVSGQPLPGTAPHVLHLIADFTVGNWRANLNYNYTDAIPLNDENTVFGDAFHLLRARVGYRVGPLELYLTGENLLDAKMSFGNDLNPRFGRRYFQPAPGINGAVGLRYTLAPG